MKELTREEFESLTTMALAVNDKYASCIIQNETLGEIVLFHGKQDVKSGFGYEHIVYKRFVNDKLTTDEITGLIVKMLEILKDANKDNVVFKDKGDKA